jgi:hypothetical protein
LDNIQESRSENKGNDNDEIDYCAFLFSKVYNEGRPIESPNLLLKTNDDGEITQCILLPLGEEEWPPQFRFGFEGVAEDDNHAVVAVQRAWGDDPNPRLAIYNTDTDSWSYVFYPLDIPESQNGGWVGTGDIAPVGNGQFLVLERDNQGGPDAVIKRVYSIDLGDYSFEDGTTIEKTFFTDLIPDLKEGNGSVLEKVEGLAVTQSGKVYINTDNDGVDNSSGEQQFLNVGSYVPPPVEKMNKKSKAKKKNKNKKNKKGKN